MNRLRIIAAVAGLLALYGCASVDSVILAEPGVAFSLPFGKTAELSGSQTRLTFKQVSEESRCPANVVCVWEGDAKIEVTVSRNGAPATSGVLSLSSPGNEAQIGGLVVRFVGLAPYPSAPGPIAPQRYVAELVIRSL